MTDFINLPNTDNLSIDKINPILTDYAIFMGAQIGVKLQNNDQINHYGTLWTNDHDNVTNWTNDNFDITNPNVHFVIHQNLPSTYPSVAPLIKNSYATGFNKVIRNGRTILTYNDDVIYYPQTRVNSAFEDELSQALRVKPSQHVTAKMITDFTIPPRPPKQGSKLRYFTLLNSKHTVSSFYYRGHNYVAVPHNKNYAWFLCEPITVHTNTNGDLQCDHALFPANNKRNSLIKYLNTDFVDDMRRSVRLNDSLRYIDYNLLTQTPLTPTVTYDR